MQSREEKKVQTEILLELGKNSEFRVFRHQVGVGYGLGIIKQAIELLRIRKWQAALACLRKAQVIKWGVPGQSDLHGIHMSGRCIWIEVKAPGKLNGESDEQKRWGAMILKYNGFYTCVDNWETLKSELEYAGLWDD